MNDKLRNLHYDLASRLEAISKLFTTPTRITLVVRTPDLPDGGVFISDDTPDAVISEITRLRNRNPV